MARYFETEDYDAPVTPAAEPRVDPATAPPHSGPPTAPRAAAPRPMGGYSPPAPASTGNKPGQFAYGDERNQYDNPYKHMFTESASAMNKAAADAGFGQYDPAKNVTSTKDWSALMNRMVQRPSEYQRGVDKHNSLMGLPRLGPLEQLIVKNNYNKSVAAQDAAYNQALGTMFNNVAGYNENLNDNQRAGVSQHLNNMSGMHTQNLSNASYARVNDQVYNTNERNQDLQDAQFGNKLAKERFARDAGYRAALTEFYKNRNTPMEFMPINPDEYFGGSGGPAGVPSAAGAFVGGAPGAPGIGHPGVPTAPGTPAFGPPGVPGNTAQMNPDRIAQINMEKFSKQFRNSSDAIDPEQSVDLLRAKQQLSAWQQENPNKIMGDEDMALIQTRMTAAPDGVAPGAISQIKPQRDIWDYLNSIIGRHEYDKESMEDANTRNYRFNWRNIGSIPSRGPLYADSEGRWFNPVDKEAAAVAAAYQAAQARAAAEARGEL